MEDFGNLRDRIGDIRRWFCLDSGAYALVLFLLCFAVDWSEAGDIIRDGQTRALLLLAGAVLFSVLKRPLTSAPAAFLSYALVMWVLHEEQSYGCFHILCVSAACLLALWLSRAERLPAILSYLGGAQAAFGLAQWLGWNPWGYQEASYLFKPSGFMGQETILGAFLAACLAPALFTRRWLCSFLIILCVFATHSSFTALSAGAVTFLFLCETIGWRRGVALAILCGGFFFGWARVHQGSDWLDPNGRLEFLRVGYAWWRERTLFGHGPGTWYPFSPETKPVWLRLTHQHNEYLEFLGEYGLAGAAVLLPGVFSFFRNFRLTWHHALCVGLMLNALGNFPFHIASIGAIFLTAWLLSVRDSTRMV